MGDQRVSVRTRRALVGSFAGLSLSAGGVAAIWGLMSGINAVRQAGGIVSVHCMAVSGKLPFSVSRGSDISVAGALYEWDNLLLAVNSTAIEQLTSRGDDLMTGLCALVAGVLLYRLLRSFLHQQSDLRRNPARLTWLAALCLALAAAAPLLPFFAGTLVLDRVRLAASCPAIPVYSGVSVALICGAVILFALGESCVRVRR